MPGGDGIIQVFDAFDKGEQALAFERLVIGQMAAADAVTLCLAILACTRPFVVGVESGHYRAADQTDIAAAQVGKGHGAGTEAFHGLYRVVYADGRGGLFEVAVYL